MCTLIFVVTVLTMASTLATSAFFMVTFCSIHNNDIIYGNIFMFLCLLQDIIELVDSISRDGLDIPYM